MINRVKRVAAALRRFLRLGPTAVNRRGFLRLLGAAAGFSALAALMDKPRARAAALFEEFLIRSVEGTQRPDIKTWRLAVTGLVENELELDYEALRALPRREQVRDFTCVEVWRVPRQRWEGVPLREIIARAAPRDGAKFITIHCSGGGYTESLTMDEAREEDTLLALKLNGRPLPPEQGFPARLVIPRLFGYKSAKWVKRLHFTGMQHEGYWEQAGYSIHAPVPKDF